MTKRDMILIFILAAIALLTFFATRFLGQGSEANAAEISADGKLVEHIILEKAQQKEYTVQGPLGKTIIQVQDGEARIIDSPCPDKLCVRMGWVRAKGQSAICVPNRILLRVVSDDNNKIDSISH